MRPWGQVSFVVDSSLVIWWSRFEPFSLGLVTSIKDNDLVQTTSMKTTAIKIFLLLSLLTAPWLVSAASASQPQSGAAGVSSYSAPSASLDKVITQGSENGHYLQRTEIDSHRCGDGGCSSVGCCVASDGYVPSERLSSANPGFIILLASVTEVFLSSDTRPPIPFA